MIDKDAERNLLYQVVLIIISYTTITKNLTRCGLVYFENKVELGQWVLVSAPTSRREVLMNKNIDHYSVS